MGGDWFDRLSGAIDRAPRAALAALLTVHVALWGLVPALTQPNLPLDMIEGLAWGREWQWAYFKHPPLPPWITEATAALFHGWDRPLFFLGALASALALYLIWLLAAEIVGRRAALLAVLLQEGVLYFTFFTPEFNHTNIQLPLWALIAWLARRAIRSGRTVDWIGTGIAGALGMMGKYSTGILLLSLALFLFIDPIARRRVKTVGPWLALAVMLVALAPHIAKVAALHFAPLHYPFTRARPVPEWYDRIVSPLQFAAAQFLDVLGAILLVALLFRARPAAAGEMPAPPFERRYVATLCWAPFLISIAISAVLGLSFKDMWGTPFWNDLGLFAVMFVTPGARLTRGFAGIWLAIFLGTPLAYAAQFPLQAVLGLKPLRGQFAGRVLAEAVDRGWHRAEGAAPLRYVAGDIWNAGNVAFALWSERPSVMIDGDPAISPWIDRSALACAGAVLVWQPSHKAATQALLARFPDARRQPDIMVPYHSWGSPPPDRVGWAIVPPRADCRPAGGKS